MRAVHVLLLAPTASANGLLGVLKGMEATGRLCERVRCRFFRRAPLARSLDGSLTIANIDRARALHLLGSNRTDAGASAREHALANHHDPGPVTATKSRTVGAVRVR